MLTRTIHLIGLVLCATVAFPQAPAPSAALPTAQHIVTEWRKAVHASEAPQLKTAVLTTTSDEDGITGEVKEWLSPARGYRRDVTRDFDNSEVVVTNHSAIRRDWNGFLRGVQGQELRRLQTAIFETQVIAFGPPKLMNQATVSESDDHKFYLLTITPPDGSRMTWYVDPKTWRPVKSVRPGDDSEITTEYDLWDSTAEVITPLGGKVSETEKPEFHWRRKEIHLTLGVPAGTFNDPKSGPSDVHLDPAAPPIPFNFESSHIILQAQLNGRAPIWFLLDTGADENVINETRLSAFGLKTYGQTLATGGGNSAQYSYAQDATFMLPGVELRNQHVAVIDQTGLERALGMPLGGLLGYDFISRFVIEIDYDKRLLTLHDPKGWTYSGNGFIVPVTFDDGIPFADGVIGVPTKPAIPAYFVMDFGAAETMTLTSPFVKANDLVNLAQTNAAVNRPAGLENQFFAQNNVRGHIGQLTLGQLTAHSIPINMSVNTTGAYASTNFSGTVGQGIFHRYHVFLDYARNRIIFEPTPEAEKPFPERQTYGLSLLASGDDLHRFTVSAVRPGSPAEKDGWRKSDAISAVDGKPASEFTLGELRDCLAHAGARHSIEVRRENDKLTIPVEVRLISLDQR